MAQVTIYINNDLEIKVKNMAISMNISISKYISNILEEKVKNQWSENVKKLNGSWSDFPTLEEIRKNDVNDLKREEF